MAQKKQAKQDKNEGEGKKITRKYRKRKEKAKILHNGESLAKNVVCLKNDESDAYCQVRVNNKLK